MSKKVELYFDGFIYGSRIKIFSHNCNMSIDTHNLTITTNENGEPLENKEAYEELDALINLLTETEDINYEYTLTIKEYIEKTKTAVIEKL